MAPKFQCLNRMKEFLVLITVQCRWAEGRGTLSQQTLGTPGSFHLVALPSPRTSKGFPARAQEKTEKGALMGGFCRPGLEVGNINSIAFIGKLSVTQLTEFQGTLGAQEERRQELVNSTQSLLQNHETSIFPQSRKLGLTMVDVPNITFTKWTEARLEPTSSGISPFLISRSISPFCGLAEQVTES